MGDTYLHIAARNHKDEIEVEDPKDLFTKNISGETPFLTAVKMLDSYAMKQLYHWSLVNKMTDGKYPIYYVFTGTKNPVLIKQIIDLGADLHAKDASGKDALQYLYDSLSRFDAPLISSCQKLALETLKRVDDFQSYELYPFLKKLSITTEDFPGYF